MIAPAGRPPGGSPSFRPAKEGGIGFAAKVDSSSKVADL